MDGNLTQVAAVVAVVVGGMKLLDFLLALIERRFGLEAKHQDASQASLSEAIGKLEKELEKMNDKATAEFNRVHERVSREEDRRQKVDGELLALIHKLDVDLARRRA